MELDTLVIGFILGLAPGLIGGTFVLMRGFAVLQGMLKEFTGIGKSIAQTLKAPSGPGGFVGFLQAAVPFLTKAGGPK